MPLGSLEYLDEHFRRQLARRCVLLARVERTDQQRLAVTGAICPVVAKHKVRAARDLALRLEDLQINVEGDPAQGNHDLNLCEQFQLAFQVGSAVGELFPGRLVAWGRTAHYSGDVGIAQRQPVVFRNAGRLRSETGFKQSFVQKVAGTIAGEHAARPIRAVCPRRQPD